MKRNGEDFTINSELMTIIGSYMDDEKREQVHSELAPCTEEEFLRRYCELDESFESDILEGEFGIEF